jgi:hypothetical protein
MSGAKGNVIWRAKAAMFDRARRRRQGTKLGIV